MVCCNRLEFSDGHSVRQENTMKRLTVTIAVALGLSCIGNAAVAMEKYTVNLTNGFAVVAFVGHSPTELAQAQREASKWEGRRHVGLGPQSIAAVAIDASETLATTPAQPASRLPPLDAGRNVADVQSH
jgi:hypothetical protein